MASGNHQAQGHGCRQQESDRAPEDAPEQRGDDHAQWRDPRAVAVNPWLHHVGHQQFQQGIEGQAPEHERPAGIDRCGKSADDGTGAEGAYVWHESGQASDGAPERRVWNAHEPEPARQHDPERGIHDQLREEEPRHALCRVFHSLHRPAGLGLPGQPDHPVPQSFVLQEDEHEQHEHDAGLPQRSPDGRKNSGGRVRGGLRWLKALGRNGWGLGGLPGRSPGLFAGPFQGWTGHDFGESIPQLLQGADGEIPHAFQFGANRFLVLRHIGRHCHQLRGQHGGQAGDARGHQQDGHECAARVSEPETGEPAFQRCDHQAQDTGERERRQEFAAEIEHRDHASGSHDVACARGRRC